MFSIWDILHLVFSLEMPSVKVFRRAFGILCVFGMCCIWYFNWNCPAGRFSGEHLDQMEFVEKFQQSNHTCLTLSVMQHNAS